MLQDFAELLSNELELVKRKFVIETKFKSKQESYQAKLLAELDAVQERLHTERAALADLEGHKRSLEQVRLFLMR